jgi:hypothetical protein
MAGNKRNVFLDFIVNDRQARQGLQGVATEAGKTQSRFQQLSGGAKALVGGFAALAATKIIGFLGDAAAAAAEDQKAQELLALAVQNSTSATDADIEKMEEWIKKTSLATGVADDELRPALAELARTTGDLETAQETLGVAMDIAAAKGIPLETVTKAIGKAALGNIGALGRLGVATKDAEGKTMTFEDTLAEAARTMGGATATAADTAAGKMKILQVRMDEAKESIGNALIPILADLAQQGSDTMKVMEFLGEKIGDLLPVSEGFGSKIMDWIGPLAISGQLMEIAAGKVDELTAAAEEAEHPVQALKDNFRYMADETAAATTALQDFESEVRSQMDPMFNLIKKTNDLADAQTDVAEARDEYGDGSPEHLEALRKEAEAFYGLKAAQLEADGTVSREQYEANLRAMGTKTSHEIDLMMAEFDRLDGRIIDTTINVNLKGRGASTWSDSLKGVKAAGGPVSAGGAYLVGEKGPEVLQMGSQGGNIIPNNKLSGGGGATTNITIHATDLSTRTLKELQEMARRR